MTRRTMHLARTVALVGVLLLAACGDGDVDDGGTPPQTPPPTTVPAPEPSAEQPSADPTEEPPPPTDDGELPSDPAPGGSELPTDAPEVADAVADLAAHLEIDPADVSVVVFEAVTWRDGSIGCPEPGMSYTQALVPGTRLVLEAQGTEYAYHAGADPELGRCDNPQEPAAGAS